MLVSDSASATTTAEPEAQSPAPVAEPAARATPGLAEALNALVDRQGSAQRAEPALAAIRTEAKAEEPLPPPDESGSDEPLASGAASPESTAEGAPAPGADTSASTQPSIRQKREHENVQKIADLTAKLEALEADTDKRVQAALDKAKEASDALAAQERQQAEIASNDAKLFGDDREFYRLSQMRVRDPFADLGSDAAGRPNSENLDEWVKNRDLIPSANQRNLQQIAAQAATRADTWKLDPVALSKAATFAEIADLFGAAGAALKQTELGSKVSDLEARVATLENEKAELENELKPLRVKAIASGRQPEQAGQSSGAPPRASHIDYKTARPEEIIANALRAQGAAKAPVRNGR